MEFVLIIISYINGISVFLNKILIDMAYSLNLLAKQANLEFLLPNLLLSLFD